MMRALLERHETGDQGTFGRLTLGALTLFTGELPWRENAANVSCIPPGMYRCTWTFSARFKRKMYLVAPVIGRAGIRKHAANLMGDVRKGFKAQLNGCIALGERLGWIDGQKALLLSAPAMRKLETLTQGQTFEMEVRECWDLSALSSRPS
jgi:hypothetical protein